MPSTCQFCLRPFPIGASLRIHQSKTAACKEKCDAHLKTLMAQAMIADSIPEHDIPSDDEEEQPPSLQRELPPIGPNLNMQPEGQHFDGHDIEPATEEGPEATRLNVSMEEVEDEDSCHFYVEEFPSNYQAGTTFGNGPMTFQMIRDDQVLQGAEVLGPFESDEEWELAKWLIKNVGHNQMEEFLKLPIISCAGIVFQVRRN
ncbi:hypothetical protein B0H10DRAFT_1843723 [Mycena sp. CBHHK59/15]|nr:hypothetical protein B0H10DRAFT_1843723 [Mycena sp. CBHHK59/15]